MYNFATTQGSIFHKTQRFKLVLVRQSIFGHSIPAEEAFREKDDFDLLLFDTYLCL
jgi:hypothetical protein